MTFLPASGVRTPVKREGAERYLLLSLVSFAASVIGTRTFLEITGYPQMGNSELHIAHVLWGGLLLFVASLLPLILANRWAYNTSAILSGVGVGLFIDEVGKFITQNNDYFYPPAAPIIYTFFLLTVFLYLRVKQASLRAPRNELYRVLDGLTEVLDHDLDPGERAVLETRLKHIQAETQDENLKSLVGALFDFIRGERLRLVEPPPKTRFQRFGEYISKMYFQHISQHHLKYFLVIALSVMGVLAMIEFIVLVVYFFQSQMIFARALEPLITQGELRSANEAFWFIIRVSLEGMTGVLLFMSAALIFSNRERTGIQLATFVLIIWLTVINLLAYYFDQFGAVVATLVQFMVLTSLIYYRRKYLSMPEKSRIEPLKKVEEQESQL